MHSSETAISTQRFVDHDLTIISEVFKQMSDGMHDNFVRTMIDTMGQSTSASGNVVARTPDLKHDLEQMLQRLKFGVDEYGVPSMPSAIVTPAMMQKIEMLVAEEDQQHSQRIAAITEEKKRDAIAEEARRISRYRFS